MVEPKRWYLRIDGRDTNAVTRATIESLIRRGDLQPVTPVCEEGSTVWREAALVPELDGLFAVPAVIRRSAYLPGVIESRSWTLRERVGRWSTTAKLAAVLFLLGTVFPVAALLALYVVLLILAPAPMYDLFAIVAVWVILPISSLAWLLLTVLAAVYVARVAWRDTKDRGAR